MILLKCPIPTWQLPKRCQLQDRWKANSLNERTRSYRFWHIRRHEKGRAEPTRICQCSLSPFSLRSQRSPSAMQVIIPRHKPRTTSPFLTLLVLMAYGALLTSLCLKSVLLSACQPAADGRKAKFLQAHPAAAAVTFPGGSQLPRALLAHGAGCRLPAAGAANTARRQLPSPVLLSLVQQTSFSIALPGKLPLNAFMAEETA